MCKKPIFLASFVLALALVSTSPVDADLVGRWKLDETSGTIASDSSGNGLDGTCQNGGTWVAGRIGGAWQGDGSDDYIDLGTPPELDLSGAGQATITAWVNIASTKNHNSIVTKGEWRDAYSLLIKGDTNPPNMLWTGNNTSVYSADTISLGEWTHVAVTINGDLTNFYINGQLNGPADQDRGEPIDNNPADHTEIGREDRSDTGSSARWYFDGMLDDVRIYNEALPAEMIPIIMTGRDDKPGVSRDPSPADKTTDVPREVILSWVPGDFAEKHNVYLGTNFDDVNSADTSSPLLISAAQVENTYAPARLDFITTYFWRVDEVNGPPDFTVHKGNIWQFTTEPVSYVIENVTATASSSSIAKGPENTVNGSGLDESGLLHGNMGDNTMWLSDVAGPQPTWIQFDLGEAHKLHEMWVWNSNESLESVIGVGLRDVTIEYSLDGTEYATLGTTHEFARAPGRPDYEHNTTIDLGGAAAKFVRLTANSNWGGIVPQFGLSEVRFFYIPVSAREPEPDSGATDVHPDVTLSWRAGREAATHDVYLGTDEQAVIDGTVPAASVTEASYSPASIDLGQTYYWKVNEVNMVETPATWEGDIWSFATPDYIVVDDFEDYNNYPPNEIWNTWLDGYGVPANGATAGYPDSVVQTGGDYMEKATVHGDEQSMPLFYSNTGGATYSEVERTFAVSQDWTSYGIQTLVLYIHGSAGNTGQLYAKINGVKVNYDGDPAAMQLFRWQQWNIDLASLGANLQSVTKLAIGIDGNGAAGTLYVDDIRLYRSAPEIVVSSEEIWFEAEAATSITAPMEIYEDPTASAGKYISTDESVGNSSGDPPADGIATYAFTVAGGTYKVSGRLKVPPDNSNSFWVRIPGAAIPASTEIHSSGWIEWNDMPAPNLWFWSDVFSNTDDEDATVLFTMEPGSYTLEIARREDGTQLDAIVISRID